MFASMSAYFIVIFCFIPNANSACSDDPIDLNAATIEQIDSLPYISSTSAQLIINLRPICSPLELTTSPKKISGITENRLNNNWNWYSDQSCDDTCCRAIASCSSSSSTNTEATYSWQIGSWSTCSAECGTGEQTRTNTCYNSTNTVDDSLCLTLTDGIKPTTKQLCNTQDCPSYEWVAGEWSSCDTNDCTQTRTVSCYDTTTNTEESDDKCDTSDKLDTTQSCETCTRISNENSIKESNDDISVTIDLLHDYNKQQCKTSLYNNGEAIDKTLITRRSCSIDIWVVINGKTNNDAIEKDWFYLTATLQAKANESVGDTWNDNYFSWYSYNTTSGWITITYPADAYIGKFIASLYYQDNGQVSNRKKVTDFTLFVLFNPYSSSDDVYVSSTTNRKEYVENTVGLIWQGLSDNNSGFKWEFDQFNIKNLEISIKLLNRLTLQYRNNIVLISRQISYAVGDDICYGKWGEGSYTSGRPSGGYYCSKTKNNCRDPSSWRGTTEIFDLYRDELDYEYPVQYCQCFVYSGIVTTVGRSLGIATRSISNFQSAHDTDFNRAIEKYWIFNEETKVYEPSDDGKSSDSIWSFHVWNDMYFKRTDFTNTATDYNVRGWQAVDATPQEYSFGGNPGLTNTEDGVYQMGPASLDLVKDNINTNDCSYAGASKKRYGCFDTEFVISEVNANYNFWWKKSTDSSDTKFKLLGSFTTDPWNDDFGTIGQQISTKKPGDTISENCLDELISDCSSDLLDITSLYKDTEPSDPSTPTNITNYYLTGQERYRRRRRRLGTINEYIINGSNSSLDLDFEGFEYNIDYIPKSWYVSTMIVADDKDEIIDLYNDDYTFGMMSINVDSYQDDIINVYCSFIVTSHNYRGDKQGNSTIKNESINYMIDPGQSKQCKFYLNYTEYQSILNDIDDLSEIPYYFNFILSASIYTNASSQEPSQSIIEQRDFIICSPIYRLRDRIICHNGLKWFEPSYNLDYECDGNDDIDINSVGDGFCDEDNNIDGCFDGGDCCKSSCIPSDNYFCEYFDCIDDRVNQESIDYFVCNEPLSFIDYMDNLFNSSICVNLNESIFNNDFNCTDKIWLAQTGNDCVDYISAIDGVFGDIKTCYNETYKSIETEMQEMIEFVIDCMDLQEGLDNNSYIPPFDNYTSSTSSTSISTLTLTSSDEIPDIALKTTLFYSFYVVIILNIVSYIF